MSKRGPRFTEKEKLAILKEGEKNGVNAVCAKYGVSEQTYRVWRYKTNPCLTLFASEASLSRGKDR
jgi:transposase-like protein